MEDKSLEVMRKILEQKKQKSAQQGGHVKHEGRIGETRKGIKRRKQGGMFDK